MRNSQPFHPLHRTGNRRLRRQLQARTRRTLYAGVLLSTAAVGVPGASLDAAVNHPPGSVTFTRDSFGVPALAGPLLGVPPSGGRAAAALSTGGGPAKAGTPNTDVTATVRRTYLVPLKEVAPGTRIPDPHREESRLEAYLRQQQIQLPEENVLKFVDVCIMELDPAEHAAFFNREWTHTEVLDAHDRVLRRWEKHAPFGVPASAGLEFGVPASAGSGAPSDRLKAGLQTLGLPASAGLEFGVPALAGRENGNGQALNPADTLPPKGGTPNLIARSTPWTAAELAELHALAKATPGTRVVHHFQNIEAIEEDSCTVGLAEMWPGALPGGVNAGSVPDGLRRLNIGVTNGSLAWATSPFPMPFINGLSNPLSYDGTNRIGVAVLDSGIDAFVAGQVGYGSTATPGHPDLEPIPDSRSYVAYSSMNGFADDVGHGTFVASIIGALDNGVNMMGIAPGVELWNVKCMGIYPNNSWANLVRGMNYATANANRISVANISITNTGTGAPLTGVRGALANMVKAGIVVVAAAGNESVDITGGDGNYTSGNEKIPAAFAESISVSAMDPRTNVLASFSNYGSLQRIAPVRTPAVTVDTGPGVAIDLAAPGVSITACAMYDPTVPVGSRLYGYGNGDGTSFAAPHVAGLAALYAAAHGPATRFATQHDREQAAYDIRKALMLESQRLQPQSDWGAPGGNTLDPDSAHEALAFPSEAWVPRPVLAWDAVGATNAQRHVTAHPEVATDTASVRGYDYRLVFTADLASPAWTPYPGATRAGNGRPVDLGWLPLTEAEYRFLRVERKPVEVP